MTDLFRIETTVLTVLGYPMSFIELAGTLLNLACVWLAARRHILNWPVGIAGTVLFGFLFYQIRLYADLLEQVYYLATGFYGWWLWTRSQKRQGQKDLIRVSRCTFGGLAGTAAAMAGGTAALAFLTMRLDRWWPSLFTAPATYPWLDSFTTVMSFAAQLLLVHRKVESWYLWITVDVIGVWLYHAKGVQLVSILYGIFLVLAVKGLWGWQRELRQDSQVHPVESL